MSGPKYYDFDLGSPEKAAGVMTQLSACGIGVKARVEGNQIKFVVSEFAWYGGADYSEISKRIDEARKAYERNEELKRILQEKKEQSKSLAAERKAAIEKEYVEERRKIETARAMAAKLRRDSSFSIETPFGSFDLGDTAAKAAAVEEKLKNDSETLEKNKRAALEGIKKAEAEIFECESISALDSCRRKISSSSVGSFSSAETVAELSSEISEKTKKLKKYKEATEKLAAGLKKAGLQGYFERIKTEISAIGVFDDGAEEKLKSVLESLEREVAVLKEMQADRENKEAIAAGVEEAVAALEEIGNALSIKTSQGVVDEVTTADYTLKNEEAVKEIEKILTEIKGLEFVGGERKGIIERIERDYSACRNSAASVTTAERLQRILALLRDEEKECKKENETYLDFKREYDRYEGLFIKAQGFLGGEKVEGSGLLFPTEVILSYDNPEQKIKELKEKNDRLEKEIALCEQEAVCAAMAAATGAGGCGKKFRKERTKDGDLHFTFVREDTKGVIFDIDCKAGGKTCVYPRGVILSNGKSTITPEKLRETHSSCRYAEEIRDSLKMTGLTECGDYRETEEAIKEATYDEKNYYRIDSFEESVRFLELSGYSETEINEILEIETESEQERVRKRAAASAAQKAIKPQ